MHTSNYFEIKVTPIGPTSLATLLAAFTQDLYRSAPERERGYTFENPPELRQKGLHRISGKTMILKQKFYRNKPA